MCYSSLVERAMRKAEKEYEARINYESFRDLYRMRETDSSLKIPDGMEDELIKYGGAFGEEIKEYVNRFRIAERSSLMQEIKAARGELRTIEEALSIKATKTAQSKQGVLQRRIQKLSDKLEPSAQSDSYRIYPYYFAPVIIECEKGREIVPMRYRILPRTGVEIPAQYNVFNARRDSLMTAKTWKGLFGKKHAIFPFVRFYEWVERDGKKVEITFNPDTKSMWAACLYEECVTDNGLIRSFAMVTDDPPQEIATAGHDRCPVYLRRDSIQEWLKPEGKSLEELDALLDNIELVYYEHSMAA